jgi:predicted dehydrogenase
MDKVRIGIIGCGGMSRHHGRMFTTQTPDVEVVGLCDTHPQNLARYQREIFEPLGHKPPTFADYRELLAQEKPDGVVIVTPHAHHFEQAMASLDAGAHVLVEKPMVVKSEHARQLIARAAKVKRTVSVAFPGPYSAEFAYIRSLIAQGELGDIILLNAMVSQKWLKPTSGTWRQDPALSGGGQAYDSGAHMFNALVYLHGLKPVEVFAWCDNRGAAVDITTVATIKYEGGGMATATVGGADVSFCESLYLSGTQGSIRTGIYGGRLEHWDAKGQLIKYPPVPDVTGMHRNFVGCIRGKAESPSPPLWGLRQSLLMDALYESARTGRPAQVAAE